MNEKKAKELRRNVLFQFGSGLTVYDEIPVKQNKIYTGKLNDDGTEQFYVFPSITRRLGECPRKHYQAMKRGQAHETMPPNNPGVHSTQ